MPTTITTIERRYCVSEAAFFIRALIGPDFGNIYTLLADQRRGKETRLPFIPYHLYGGKPYYLSTDLHEFIQDVRDSAETRLLAKSKVSPVYFEVDLEKEIMLP